METNKIKSCAGCVGLSKRTNVGQAYVFCSGLFNTVKIEKTVYDKRLDIDVDIKPINNCKCKNMLTFVNMCINNEIKNNQQ